MSTLATLAVNIIGNTKGLQSAMTEAHGAMRASAEKIKTAGTTLSLAVTAPVVGAGTAVLKMAGDFQASMNRVEALTGLVGDTTGTFEKLKDQAKELGATTAFSASEAADAMGFLAMAGFKADQIMTAMPATLQLAASASVDLGTAADIASNILSGFGFEAAELGRVNDILVKTMTSSNVDLRMLGESMKYVAPMASSLGLEFEEVSAAIGLMGNAGIQGSMAGTALRGALARLAAPTKEVSKTLADLGVNVFDTSGNLLPLAGILGQLEEAGASTADMMAIFSVEAGPAMQALLGQGSDALLKLTEDLRNSGGTAETVAAANMKGLNGAMKELKSALEGLALAVADTGLIEFVEGFVRSATGLLQNLSKTNPQLLRMAAIAAAVAAAIGPLMIGLGTLMSVMAGAAPIVGAVATALGLIVSPIGLIVAGLAALWAFDVGGIQTKLMGMFEGIASAAQFAWPAINELVARFTGFGEDTYDTNDSIRDFVLALTGSKEAMENVDAAVIATGTVFRGFIDILSGNEPLGDWSTWFEDLERSLGTGVAETISSVGRAMYDLKESVTGFIAGDLDIAGFLGGVQSAIGEIDFAPARDQIVAALGLDNISFESVVAGVQQFGSDLQAKLAELATSIDWTPVTELFGSLATTVTDAIAGIDWAGVAEWFGSLKTAVTDALSSIDWTPAAELFGSLKTTVTEKLAGIDWAGALANIGEGANSLRDGAIAWLTEKIAGIDWSALSLDFAGFINSLADKIASIDWSEFRVEEIGAALLAVLAPGIAGAIAAFQWVIDSENWAGLGTAITDALAAIEWGELGTAFANLGSAVVNAVTSLDWSGVTGAFSTLKTNIMTALRNLVTGATGAFETPEWIATLLEWEFPSPDELLAWVFPDPATLLSWAFPDPATLLSWAFPSPTELLGWKFPRPSDLFSWRWPSIPTPEWLERLLNWTPSLPGWLGGGGSQPGGQLGKSHFHGGPIWVGEGGRELLWLPRGSQITPHQEAEELAAVGAGGMNAPLAQTIVVRSNEDIHRIAYAVWDLQQRRRRRG